jgi:SAM-dependent methyltransferase
MAENPLMGSEEYFARLYEVEAEHWWSRGMRELAGGMLEAHYGGPRPVLNGLRVLDAGCGTGITLKWLNGYQPRVVVGIDLFPQPLQFCRARGAGMLSQSSVLALPFAADSFDLIVCNDVIQHLPGAEADALAFGEFYRTLAPGGRLLLRTNSRQGSRETSAADAHHRLYQTDELRARLRAAGFQVEKITYANALMGVIPAVRKYLKQSRTSRHHHHQRHHDHGLAIRMLPPHLRWLNTPLYWVMKSEAWLFSRPAFDSPFGQSILCLAQKPTRAGP